MVRTGAINSSILLCALTILPLPVSAAGASFTSRSIGADFALIPAGSFTMGTPTASKHYRREERQRPVIISKPFYLQTTEVTQKQWKKIMQKNPSRFRNCGPDCPVENVSWVEVQEFIRRLNKREKTAAYRLPTEAEWEYAVRAGSGTTYPWGDAPDCSRANYGHNPKRMLNECGTENPGRTAKAAGSPPNAWGLHDLAGNVSEWVVDIDTAYRPSLPAVDPRGPTGPRWEASAARVLRGGNWASDLRAIGSASRSSVLQGERYGRDGSGTIGFRLVREVDDDSPDFQPVPQQDLQAVRTFPADHFVLTETVPVENLLLPQNVGTYQLLASSVSGTLVHYSTGQVFGFAASWTLPPERMKVGDTVSIAYETTYALVIEPFWQWGTFPVQTTVRGDGKQVAVMNVPDIADWFGIRVRIRSSYLEAGWVYHYERNLY